MPRIIQTPFLPRDFADPTLQQVNQWKQSLENQVNVLSNAALPPSFADNITPRNSGDNQHFYLPQAPNPPESLSLRINGLFLSPGIGNDYVLTRNLITLTVPIVGVFKMLASYRY